MSKLHALIERHWQQPQPALRLLLFPLSRLFEHIVRRRRSAFLDGRRPAERLPVPVVVVGNLHAGGTGKTPVTAHLAQAWQADGLRVGIISRGYGRSTRGVYLLHPDSTAAEAGDEPLLLYRQTGAPTAVAAQRADAAHALLAAHPDLDVLLADDGLQHYALARDIEIAVFPFADRGRRDLDVLPNGALREPPDRLHSVDAVVYSGSPPDWQPEAGAFAARLIPAAAYRLNRPSETLSLDELHGSQAAALAAIARPQRFFDTLTALGIRLNATYCLPDHAPLHAADLPQAERLLITEKDAVKLIPCAETEHVWVLPVRAEIHPDLAARLRQRLQTAARK